MFPSAVSRSLQRPPSLQSRPLVWCFALTILLVLGSFLPGGGIFPDQNSYLTFHGTVEILAISISLMVFSLAWNLRDQARSGQGLVLGLGFLAVGLIDVAHALAFPGMPGFFVTSNLEQAIYYWLAARTVAAVTFLLIALWHPPVWSRQATILGLAGTLAFTFAVYWVGVRHLDWLPRTFIPGQGLTAFKIWFEYVLAFTYAVSALLLYRAARKESYGDSAWLAAAAWVLALTELFLTLYSSATDLFNFLGHVYKAIAYLMVYRALFVEGVRAPYNLLTVERVRLRTIIETIPDLVWLKDTKGAYLLCNPAFERLYGASEHQIVGKTDYDFVERSVADFFREKDQLALALDGPSINEETLQFASNGYRGIFETKKTRVVGPGGTPIGVLGISRDVSEAKRAQAELAQARDTLEEQVRLRTAQLSEAKEAAEAATMAKANFLANMSHEIRTPLNAVLGMAHLALSASRDPRVKSYIQKILKSGQHLMGVLNDILDFSKIDAGKMVMEHIDVDVAQLLQEASDMVAEKCTAKGIDLVVDLPADVPPAIMGDPLHLRQILINYLNNAVKFTDRGSITMAVRVLSREARRAQLRFEVRDTGVGIDAAHLNQLFRSFQQGDSSTTRRYGGTGLGLAIAKRLAEAMGGTVGVDSKVGVGSAFWLEAAFDVAEGGVASAHPGVRTVATAATARPAAAAVAGLGGRRALVVEDNDLNQEVAREFLRENGLEVDVAANGAEALARLEQHNHYDVILMDVQMPVMDGIEATKRLRQDPRYRTLPVIAMTASAMQRDQDECIAAGMNDYIAKPVDPEALTRTLLKWLTPFAVPGPQPQAATPGRSASPEVSVSIPDVEGLDTVLGLRQTGGNRELYLSLLGKFADIHATAPDLIGNALDAGDWPLAERLVHTLKGVSGTIGAVRVQDESAGLEAALKQRSPRSDLDRHLQSLKGALGLVLAGLRALPAPRSMASSTIVDPAKLESVCARLEVLLGHSDAEADEVLSRNRELLERAFPAECRKLEELVAAYDYEAAALVLREARQGMRAEEAVPGS